MTQISNYPDAGAIQNTDVLVIARAGKNYRLAATQLPVYIADSRYPSFVRCSVSSGVPNPTSSLSAQASIYVMPHNGNTYSQWNGTKFLPQTFAEQTIALDAAHQAANLLYDIYLFLDGSTVRAGVGGMNWASSTNRGTGAATAEVETVNGVLVNKVAMTVYNGVTAYAVAARYGTLVGTIRCSANGQINWTAADRGLWNKYNQMPAGLFACPGYADNNSANTYNSVGTVWAEANAGTGSRVQWVQGEPQVPNITLSILTAAGAASSSLYGVGFDSITQADGSGTTNNTATATGALAVNNKGVPLSIGSHYASLLIARGGANNATFYADAGRRGGEAVDSPETYMTGTLMM